VTRAGQRAPRKPPDLDSRRGETPSKEVRHAGLRQSCGGLSLIGIEGGEAGVYPFSCGLWRCRRCGARKLRQTRKRLEAGLGRGQVWLITITSPGDEPAEASMEKLSERWKTLHLRLERRFGALEYAAVAELQRRGSPHLHILLRGPAIPRQWMSRNASDVGFGRKVDVRPAARSDPRYLTKAIGPGTDGDHLPAHFRRIRWSKGWSLQVPPRVQRSWDQWYAAAAGTLRTAASAIARGYRVVEVVNGPPDRGQRASPVRWRSLPEVFLR
jgi:hypothetical protein